MESARYNLKQKQTQNWTNVTDQLKHSSQSEQYQKEKQFMFTAINNFMTKLITDKDRLKNSSNKHFAFEINTTF